MTSPAAKPTEVLPEPNVRIWDAREPFPDELKQLLDRLANPRKSPIEEEWARRCKAACEKIDGKPELNPETKDKWL